MRKLPQKSTWNVVLSSSYVIGSPADARPITNHKRLATSLSFSETVDLHFSCISFSCTEVSALFSRVSAANNVIKFSDLQEMRPRRLSK